MWGIQGAITGISVYVSRKNRGEESDGTNSPQLSGYRDCNRRQLVFRSTPSIALWTVFSSSFTSKAPPPIVHPTPWLLLNAWLPQFQSDFCLRSMVPWGQPWCHLDSPPLSVPNWKFCRHQGIRIQSHSANKSSYTRSFSLLTESINYIRGILPMHHCGLPMLPNESRSQSDCFRKFQ